MDITARGSGLDAQLAQHRSAPGRELQATLLELVNLALSGTQCHWSVVGPSFRSLHLQLDDFVDAWRELADTVAERAVAIGFSPDAQVETLAAASDWDRFDVGPIEDQVVVRTLARRLTEVAENVRARVKRMADDDAVSQDVLIGVVRTLEEHLWMTRAQIHDSRN
jgi:starvation-inducible DNA-binding protein